ncbi:MAG: hypothetical protein ACK5LY_07385 [Lachnospirales bacterium]
MNNKILDLIEIALEKDLETRDLKFCNSKNIDNWDSLSIMNLVVLLEENFNITLTDEDINQIMQSGENIPSIVEKRLNNGTILYNE